MLPDFIDGKEKLQTYFRRLLQSRVNHMLGPLSEIPQHSMFEGTSSSMIRPDKNEEVVDMDALQGSFEFRREDVPNLSLQEIHQIIKEMAGQISDQLARKTYGTIMEASESTGNRVDAGSSPSPESIIEVFRVIDIQFDDNGQPQMPDVHIHPDMKEKMSEVMSALENDPKHRKELRDVIESKRREWNVREASRKLVG